MTKLTRWWRQISGCEMAETAGFARGWMEGFNAGLKVSAQAERGAGFMAGFVEGRQSTRTIPLDEDQEVPCSTH